MSTTTKTGSDKIKLLEQMLEDLAGDEYEDFDADKTSAGAHFKDHDFTEYLDEMETFNKPKN